MREPITISMRQQNGSISTKAPCSWRSSTRESSATSRSVRGRCFFFHQIHHTTPSDSQTLLASCSSSQDQRARWIVYDGTVQTAMRLWTRQLSTASTWEHKSKKLSTRLEIVRTEGSATSVERWRLRHLRRALSKILILYSTCMDLGAMYMVTEYVYNE